MKENKYDLIIIGAGSAGCSAAIYSTRYAMKTLIISGPMIGGLIGWAADVENYPGFESINGFELGQKFVNHAKALGAEMITDSVINIVKNDKYDFSVLTGDGMYNSKTVIIATGTNHRKLNVKNEDRLRGKGVSYCATCDGFFFKDKVVAVIGGGNSAVEGVNEISTYAKHVYIIYRNQLSAAQLYIDNMRSLSNVTEVERTNVLGFIGLESLDSLELDTNFNGSSLLKVDGAFIEIGFNPNNKLAVDMGINVSALGYVLVDPGMGTNIDGVFCAGDLNNASNNFHQQVTSAAEGSIAAQSAFKYIRGVNWISEV